MVSNAALHWVRDQPGGDCIHLSRVETGRPLVLEMGGRGNLHHLLDAIYKALRALGVAESRTVVALVVSLHRGVRAAARSEWTGGGFRGAFRSATILEGGDRGLKLWLEMFGRFALDAIAAEQRNEFFRLTGQFAGPALFHNGVWTIDYKRLRLVAVKL